MTNNPSWDGWASWGNYCGDFLDGQKMYGCEKLFSKYVIKYKSWIFGLNPEKWPEFLVHYGWHVIEDIDLKELNYRYIIPSG